MHKIARYFYVFLALIFVQNAQPSPQVIDTYEWRDLELFASPNNSHTGLAGKFDQISTSFGKQQLEQNLKSPTVDILVIQERQRALASLLSSTDQRATVMHHLAQLNGHADGLTGLFAGSEHEKALELEVHKMFYFGVEMLQDWNTSSWALDARHAFQQTALFTPVLEYIVFHLALEFIRGKLGDGHHHSCSHHRGGHDHKKRDHHDDHHKHETTSSLIDRAIDAIHVGHLVMLPFSIKELYDQLRNKINLINVIYNRVAAASACFKAMHALHSLTQKNSDLLAALGQNNALAQIFNDASLDAEMHELVELLLGDEFPLDDQLSFFSSVGTTLKTYKLLQKNYQRIRPALDVVGALDALCAVACHIEKHQATPARYSFVEFVERDKPFIAMQALWNPLLNADTVVTNDFCAGDDSNPGKVIITGPNKAGKSSIIKALALSLILAQTYGIAAAQACSMTPFHKILTYIMIMDDIAADQSKFVASILRADKCMQTVSQLASHEFAFGIFDDSLFEGTTHEKREAASLQFIKELGSYKNAIVIAATHLQRLTTLEHDDPERFKNYTIQIVTNPDGKKLSTFLLTSGVCPAQSVFDVIDGQGYTLHA